MSSTKITETVATAPGGVAETCCWKQRQWKYVFSSRVNVSNVRSGEWSGVWSEVGARFHVVDPLRSELRGPICE